MIDEIIYSLGWNEIGWKMKWYTSIKWNDIGWNDK